MTSPKLLGAHLLLLSLLLKERCWAPPPMCFVSTVPCFCRARTTPPSTLTAGGRGVSWLEPGFCSSGCPLTVPPLLLLPENVSGSLREAAATAVPSPLLLFLWLLLLPLLLVLSSIPAIVASHRCCRLLLLPRERPVGCAGHRFATKAANTSLLDKTRKAAWGKIGRRG